MNKLFTIQNTTAPGSDTLPADSFARQYYLLRKKENRIYTDEELVQLPEVNKTNPYLKEWQIRKKSSERLLKQLKNKNGALQILEVGCGNGWLCAQLASLKNATITGIDINIEELQQAERVFAKHTNLSFEYGDLQDGIIAENSFDVIIFAASIQYFCSLKKILTRAIQHLSLQGEIHIIDSHFYPQNKISAAKKRTEQYFESLGFASMAAFYFHHGIEELKNFNPVTLYDPMAFKNRFSKNKNPFYHMLIKNKYQ